MPVKSDVIVLGVGGMGSAACYHLAKRGVGVIGIEQFPLAHDRGSSHGDSRVIRKAYFEDPDYVPLLQRAYGLWEGLEKESGKKLFHKTGVFIAGPENGGQIIPGVLKSAKRFSIPVREFSRDAMRVEFPDFAVPENFHAILEPDAGYLEVENCVRAHAGLAVKNGALIKSEETVLKWSSSAKGVSVTTDKAVYEAAQLVVTAGAWSSRILSDLKIPLAVHRNLQFWYDFKRASLS